ncbi:ICln_channel domain-containing protein [Cephalotus follicularis]|uniref:ICln_channel domain-containing protein n=1 Tax=Cephalotus follicularis TaxID=3775 RepID=A0A1Q3BA03_CEPFO|nr:ICln_channel domain-containing protein [Cephalotus follicularis]
MAVGLKQFTNRGHDGQPALDSENGEELMHVQPGVSIVLGHRNRAPESPGTLYLSTKRVVWLSDADIAKGYAVDFLSITLHALSRDPESYPSPCIYAQIETEADEDDSECSDSECNEPLDLSLVGEMRLIPSDPRQLEILFEIFCEGAELNPEPITEDGGNNPAFSTDLFTESSEGEDFDGDLSQNPATSIGHSNGDHDLARSVLELQINDQRFEDAEEMEHGSDGGHSELFPFLS